MLFRCSSFTFAVRALAIICACEIMTMPLLLARSSPYFSAAHPLRLVLASPVNSVDPRQSADKASDDLGSLIHCALFGVDARGQAVPSAAAAMPRWVTSSVLELELRTDLKFSDGSPLTSVDVVASYLSLRDEQSFARRQAMQQVTKIEALNAHTIRFTLAQADASFISRLDLGLLPAHVASAKSLTAMQTARATCGPYQLKSIDAEAVTLERNPHFTSAPAPKIQSIVLRVIKNEALRLQELQEGKLDLVLNAISPDNVKTLEKTQPRLQVVRSPGLKTSILGFNMRDKIVGNAAVRSAIGLSIDRQEIIDFVFAGMATPATTLLPPSSPYFASHLKPLRFDLEAARLLLDQAGFPLKGETRFELSFKTTTEPVAVSIAKAIASQLKKVGIKVVVETLEQQTFQRELSEGRLQLWSFTWDDIKDPDIYRYAFATESFPPKGANQGRLSHPALDSLFSQGLQTHEPEARRTIYRKVQELIEKEQPCLFLWHEPNVAVFTQDLKDFVLSADGHYAGLR